MAEVLARVQPPDYPQAAPQRVVGKTALAAHPRATVLSAQFSVRDGRGEPPRKEHALPQTGPPHELTPSQGAHPETNK